MYRHKQTQKSSIPHAESPGGQGSGGSSAPVGWHWQQRWGDAPGLSPVYASLAWPGLYVMAGRQEAEVWLMLPGLMLGSRSTGSEPLIILPLHCHPLNLRCAVLL